ncbi:probable WRKY transcription factor 65 isoform X2 [Cornus florida]|uniref:probable WRKY transcription factor 65 isoform X2 n=1 Tax=Cornus florida TaxID=4283 RepID=UPI0028A0765F|nr:probable WRKY transcription factor 65 isoform X2 [Cornus florida]
MDGRFSTNPFLNDQEDNENSPENSCDSPTSAMFNDSKITSTSSPKRRRALQKRVVSVPIRAVEGSGLKSETSAPPSDSWAWRKYGQKPIKGSPYPRGYYRCSSSKGCPARKQVERSRVDPTMLVITYSCEHNHPWPASRNNHHHHHNNAVAETTTVATPTTTVEVSNSDNEKLTVFEPDPDEKFANLGSDSLITGDEFRWFPELESTFSTVLESPILAEESVGDTGAAVVYPMREEEDSLFADLGELPECSMVFRRGVMEEVRRRCGLTPWCGTTG